MFVHIHRGKGNKACPELFEGTGMCHYRKVPWIFCGVSGKHTEIRSWFSPLQEGDPIIPCSQTINQSPYPVSRLLSKKQMSLYSSIGFCSTSCPEDSSRCVTSVFSPPKNVRIWTMSKNLSEGGFPLKRTFGLEKARLIPKKKHSSCGAPNARRP
jgi:hypothetical protein